MKGKIMKRETRYLKASFKFGHEGPTKMSLRELEDLLDFSTTVEIDKAIGGELLKRAKDLLAGHFDDITDISEPT